MNSYPAAQEKTQIERRAALIDEGVEAGTPVSQWPPLSYSGNPLLDVCGIQTVNQYCRAMVSKMGTQKRVH